MKNFDFEAATTSESIGKASYIVINLKQIGYPKSEMVVTQNYLGGDMRGKIVVRHNIPFLNLDDVETVNQLKDALARRLYELVGDDSLSFEELQFMPVSAY